MSAHNFSGSSADFWLKNDTTGGLAAGLNDLHIGCATILIGDCIERMKELPDGSVQTCVTSPPYFGLRDYGVDGQIGIEKTPDEYVAKLVEVFREVRRVLRDDGTLWLNLGDSYASSGRVSQPHRDSSGGIGKKGTRGKQGYAGAGGGYVRPNTIGGQIKPKDLIGIPWRVAFALQADGWFLRQDIIWHKPNPMPESVRDRCTKAHEYIFLLSKSKRYYFDNEPIREPVKATSGKINGAPLRGAHVLEEGGRRTAKREYAIIKGANRRSVWTVATRPYKGAHFATFPPTLIEPCILAGSRPGDIVLDPFNGSGTTGYVAIKHGRRYVGIELNPGYLELTRERIEDAIKAAQIELFDEALI